jgi:hypothetical protein
MPLLNLDPAPDDPVERIMWLSGVMKQAKSELDDQLAKAYFDARLQGRLDAAVSAGPYARKTVLAITRRENQSRGRMVRWRDGADPSSSAFRRNDR